MQHWIARPCGGPSTGVPQAPWSCTGQLIYVSYSRCEKGEKKNAEYPDFSGYAEVIDPAGKVLYRIDVKPGTIKPDDSLFVTAADNLDYMLSTSLSDTFCLKLSKAFGGF